MNLQEITQEIGKLKNWSLGNNAITKNFEFKDFKESMDFVSKVGEIAESRSHHPDITINYNRVKLSLTTHSINELTKKDFEVALEIDGLD